MQQDEMIPNVPPVTGEDALVKQPEGSEVVVQAVGSELLHDIETRLAAREKVREKLRRRIGEMYW